MLQNGSRFEAVFRVVLENGSLRWCRYLGEVKYEEGEPTRLGGAIIYVTRATEVSDMFASEASRIHLAEEAAGFGLWEMDVATGLIQFSEHPAAMHGLPTNGAVKNPGSLGTQTLQTPRALFSLGGPIVRLIFRERMREFRV